ERVPMPKSNSLLVFFRGHTFEHSPHPVHFEMSTYRAFFRIVISKFPTKPSTASTSEYVYSLMRGCCPTSTMRGVRIHCEQSSVGKVSDSPAILPPTEGSRSTITTSYPASAISNA